MSKTIRYKLYGNEIEAAAKFAKDVGIPLDRLAKLSLFYTMREGYSSKENTNSESTQRNIAGDTPTETQVGVPSNSDALSDQVSMDGNQS